MTNPWDEIPVEYHEHFDDPADASRAWRSDLEVQAWLDRREYKLERTVHDDGTVFWQFSAPTHYRTAFIAPGGMVFIHDNSRDGFDGLEAFAAYATRVLTAKWKAEQ